MPNTEDTEKKPLKFQLLDPRNGCRCFGGFNEDEQTWISISDQSVNDGWNQIDIEQLEDSLTNDVNDSYYNIASLELLDAGTNIVWIAKFINDKSLWKLEIKDSPKAEVLDDDKSTFFVSENFVNLVRKCGDILDNAKTKIENVLMNHLENGELLQVDEVKLAAILFWLNDKQFMENFRTCKYIY